ncbi:MAG TPA: hypothetical protein VL362_01970 [Patescibacteria group bacterium]|jgi:hypothetical protein|nr:hypothetical protein [Patescibacteria group bacterium]
MTATLNQQTAVTDAMQNVPALLAHLTMMEELATDERNLNPGLAPIWSMTVQMSLPVVADESEPSIVHLRPGWKLWRVQRRFFQITLESGEVLYVRVKHDGDIELRYATTAA